MIAHLTYGILFVLTLLSALGVVLWRSAVHAAISLVVTMLSLAGLFLLMQAELVAAIQVVVYAGAIVVLFLFVIMMLNLREPESPVKRLRWVRFAGLALAAALLAQTVVFTVGALGAETAPEPVAVAANQEREAAFDAIGVKMLTQYALPFELTSILLLVAILGAVVVARRSPAPGEPEFDPLEEESEPRMNTNGHE
jgi:NADH-quinone oxidoreductase subunit J